MLLRISYANTRFRVIEIGKKEQQALIEATGKKCFRFSSAAPLNYSENAGSFFKYNKNEVKKLPIWLKISFLLCRVDLEQVILWNFDLQWKGQLLIE